MKEREEEEGRDHLKDGESGKKGEEGGRLGSERHTPKTK